MRIALVTRALPSHGGGGMERLTADLAVAWVRLGHEVTCVTTPLPVGGAAPLEAAGVHVREVAGTPGRYSPAWRAAVAEEIDPGSFDVVVGVSSGAASLLHRPTRTPLVMQAHGTALAEVLSKLRAPTPRAIVGAARNLLHVLEDWHAYPRYSSLVAVGPGVARDLRWVPRRFRPRRVEVILNGVPRPGAAVSAPHDGGFAAPRLAFVGRLRREKGADLLVRALAERTGTAVIVGEGPERARLEALAARLGVGDRVEFLGAVDRERVGSLIGSVDVVVLPSRRREGLPLVLLETLLLGRRAVVSRQMAASLPGGGTAGVVPVDLTPRAVATAIDAALAGPAPSEDTAARFDIDVCAERYVQHFAELIAAQAE